MSSNEIMTSLAPDGSRPTVRTRILVISDTHTQIPKPSHNGNHTYREPLPTADILLHAGDITKCGKISEYESMVEMIKNHPAELKLVIAGNHDITLDPPYYHNYYGKQKHRGEDLEVVREMWTGEEAKKHGLVYLEEGTNTFQLTNGAKFTIYSSPYQPEFCNWAFAYPRDQDRYNPNEQSSLSRMLHRDKHPPAANPIPDHPNVDIMLTHGPPMGILDKTWRGEAVGCDHLLRAARRSRPLLHCFGHIHEGWGAARKDWEGGRLDELDVDLDQARENRCVHFDFSSKNERSDGVGQEATATKHPPLKWGEETLFINAAIMDVNYNPTNAPWLVDLDLPVRE